MAKSDKSMKSGFVIKLSTETVQKLVENEESKSLRDLETSGVIIPEIQKKNEVGAVQKSDSITRDNTLKTGINEEKFKLEIDKNENQAAIVKTRQASTSSEGSTDMNNKDDKSSWGDYAPYIVYDGDTAIYTDPSTNQKYTWCNTSSTWVIKSSEQSDMEVPGRVYSYENDTHIYTDQDGSKFFWDLEKKAWFPKVDDDFLAYYQMSYGFIDNTSKEESTETSKKSESDKKNETPGVKRKLEPQWFDASEDNNTKVYVSNLPLELTEEEFVDFMQKCGLVMRDPKSQKMKIKLYMDKEQNCFKGDALCTYIKIESVDLALNLLDGSDLKGNKIKVEKASFQLKGEYNPALKPKKKKKKELEKLKRMQEKLFDWRPEKFIGERSKHERVVIIKNLFHSSDFDKEVQLILDYQQDLREECGKCGEVRKVVIYDRHPDGVAQVTMKEPEEADAVVQLIHNRWFGKRKLTAEIWDGRTKYKIAETDAEINKRIDKWEKFLEDDDKGAKDSVVEEAKGDVEESLLREVKETSSADVEAATEVAEEKGASS